MKTRKSLPAVLLITALAIPAAPVGADMLPAPGPAARSSIAAALVRDDVRSALQARGVDARDVGARVQALTDDEAALVAKRIDELAAGGRGEALPVAVLAVIVIYYLWPVIVFAAGVTIISALNGRAGAGNGDAAVAAVRPDSEEASWGAN